MIKIGGQKLATAVPEDLDGRVAAILGCSALEAKRQLEGFCIAGTVAKALLPLLVAPPPRHELARLIADEGVTIVRKRALRLYAAALHPKKEKHVPQVEG